MKRVVVMFVAMVLAISGVFAKSDIQFQFGMSGLDASVDGYSKSLEDKGVVIGFRNYNLFGEDSNGVFSIGFVNGFSANFINGDIEEGSVKLEYNEKSFNMIIGPAIGINFGGVFKLQGDFCFSVGAAGCDYKETVSTRFGSYKTDDSDTTPIYGFSCGMQLKIAPNAPISPVGGFRYTYDKLSISSDDTVDVTAKFLDWYLALAINIGG